MVLGVLNRFSFAFLVRLPVLAGLFLYLMQGLAASENFDLLLVSIDRTVETPIGALSRQSALESTPEGLSQIKTLPLPANAQIAGLDLAGESLFFVPDIVVNIAGMTMTPRDIATVASSGAVSKEVSASALGLQPPVKISAIEQYQTGFLFTVDINADIGGFNATPRDVLYYDGASVSLHLTGEALGISATGAIGGLETSLQGNVIFSVKTSSVEGLENQQRGAIYVYFDGEASAKLIADNQETLGSCFSCEIAAIAGQFDDDIIFRSSFNSNWEAK